MTSSQRLWRAFYSSTSLCRDSIAPANLGGPTDSPPRREIQAEKGEDELSLFAQALWLALHVHVPAESAIVLSAELLEKLGATTASAPRVAATARLFAHMRGKVHPRRHDLQQFAVSMLAECAQARQVDLEHFNEWITVEGLNDPQHFLPALEQDLVALVGDQPWLFDRAQIQRSFSGTDG